MIHVQTIQQRDAVPNSIAFVQGIDGEWDVYQIGDILPVVPLSPIYLQCSAIKFKKALAKKNILSIANTIMNNSIYAVDWISVSTFSSNTKMIIYLGKSLKKPGGFISSIFQLANQIGA